MCHGVPKLCWAYWFMGPMTLKTGRLISELLPACRENIPT